MRGSGLEVSEWGLAILGVNFPLFKMSYFGKNRINRIINASIHIKSYHFSLPGIQSGGIAEKLAIPAPTVKRILAALLSKGLIEKQGSGRGTNYSAK